MQSNIEALAGRSTVAPVSSNKTDVACTSVATIMTSTLVLLRSTTSLGLFAPFPPAPSSCSMAFGFMSKPVTSKPFQTRCFAIPSPIAPRPMKPAWITFSIAIKQNLLIRVKHSRQNRRILSSCRASFVNRSTSNEKTYSCLIILPMDFSVAAHRPRRYGSYAKT